MFRKGLVDLSNADKDKTAFDLSVEEAYGVSPNAARYDLPAVMPPSITKPEPAMYLDSSDAR